MKSVKPFSIFFCLTILFFSHSLFSYDNLRKEPFDHLAQNLKDLELALIFCPENERNCDTRDLIERYTQTHPKGYLKKMTKAVVRIKSFWPSVEGAECVGTVVHLKKGKKTCSQPILLTAGHCFTDYDNKGSLQYISVFRSPRQEITIDGDKINRFKCKDDSHDCLVVNSLYNDHALIPLGRIPKGVTPLEINLDDLDLETEESDNYRKSCYWNLYKKYEEKEKKLIDMAGYYLTKKFNFLPSDRVLGLKCPVKGMSEPFFSPINHRGLFHYCLLVKGQSGSLMVTFCDKPFKRKVFFLHTHGIKNTYNISHQINRATFEKAFSSSFCKGGE